MKRNKIKMSVNMKGVRAIPVIMYNAEKKSNLLKGEEILEVTTDNPDSIELDFKIWCNKSGHRVVDVQKTNNSQIFYVKKPSPKKKR